MQIVGGMPDSITSGIIVTHYSRTIQAGTDALRGLFLTLTLLGAIPLLSSGCRSAGRHAELADEAAYINITNAQRNALGHTEPFSIERPSDTLRRRLLQAQGLPVSKSESSDTTDLEQPDDQPDTGAGSQNREDTDTKQPPPADTAGVISLVDALRIAARENREYQSHKETIFSVALDLDLAQQAFRAVTGVSGESHYSHNRAGDKPLDGMRNSAVASLGKTFMSGAEISFQIAADLVNLLSGDTLSAVGLVGDSSISIPLMRGAGRDIVGEPLTQAERNTVYAIYEFEEYKRDFAVDITRKYYDVLSGYDGMKNARENLRRLEESAERAIHAARAGRLPGLQVDQARQDVLNAREGWIRARRTAEERLDNFKLLMGIPPDALIKPDPSILSDLVTATTNRLVWHDNDGTPIPELRPDRIEMDSGDAVRLALTSRCDLQVMHGRVLDARRGVIVAADGLRGEVTLLGRAAAGSHRGIDSVDAGDAKLDFDRGHYSALLKLDLPLERTAERVAYRKSIVNLDKSVRDVQELEDSIKFAVRSRLRTLGEKRESVAIQVLAMQLAKRRERSTGLFMQAGRAQIRDLLEARAAVLAAENALTAAIVDYELARLGLQRDMGILEVTAEGLYSAKIEN